jgi:ribosomal protein L15
MIDAIIVVVVVAILGVYVSWRAGRLDRLHARLEARRAALEVALVRRSSVALELASSGLLDPATSLLLASAAHDARSAQNGHGWVGGQGAEGGQGTQGGRGTEGGQGAEGGNNGQELPESDLTRALRAVFGQPGFRSSLDGTEGADELLSELEGAAHQVFLARKFYNDAVAATRAARRTPLVRLLRLAGGAPLPEFFEIEDSLVGTGEAGQGADMPHLTG